jgi:hypothetical protein
MRSHAYGQTTYLQATQPLEIRYTKAKWRSDAADDAIAAGSY